MMKAATKILFLFSTYLGAICGLISCKTIESTRMAEKVDYEAKNSEKKVYITDSVYVHYSDTVRIIDKGDTVLIESIKWRTQEKYRFVTDTLIVNDTVKVINTSTEMIQVEKAKPVRSFFDRLGTAIIWIVSVALICIILYLVLKYFIKRRF